jgi:hypothetical protein
MNENFAAGVWIGLVAFFVGCFVNYLFAHLSPGR